MNVWIVNPYGTLPSEGWREYRSSMLARALVKRGHHPTWFLSNFEHRSKSFRQDQRLDPALPGVTIHCLPARPYQRNISFSRIRYEQSFGKAFQKAVQDMPKPDCIVLAEPCLFFGEPVRRYARENAIPLVVDILDLWPEMFALALPNTFRPAARTLFAPLYARRSRLFREATGIVGCTASYSNVARKVSCGPVETFYLGVDVDDVQQSMHDIPVNLRLPAFDGLTCVYAGTLGEAYDIPCLAAAVTMLPKSAAVRIVVAGAGPERTRLEQLALVHPNTLIFLGEIAPHQLGAIYAQAQIGLCSYAVGSTVEMPVKLFDYLAAGLAVITSLEGEITTLIDAGAGVRCNAGDAPALVAALTSLAQRPDQVSAMQKVAARFGCKFDQYQQHAGFSEFIEQLAHP